MKRKKYAKSDVVFSIVNYLMFGIFMLICTYPFYYLIINTISSNDLSANGYINFWPRQIHFGNYEGEKYGSIFIPLQVDIQLLQHHLLKMLSIFHCIILAPLSKIRCS